MNMLSPSTMERMFAFVSANNKSWKQKRKLKTMDKTHPTKTAHLSEFLGHCIRDYIGDYRYIEEAVKAIEPAKVGPIAWELAQVHRTFTELNTALTNLEKLINDN